MAFSVNITRASPYDTSYEIWTKLGSAPLEYGDGTYLTEVEIEPWETSVSFTLTPLPPAGNYGFLVAPIQRREIGIVTLVPAQAVP